MRELEEYGVLAPRATGTAASTRSSSRSSGGGGAGPLRRRAAQHAGAAHVHGPRGRADRAGRRAGAALRNGERRSEAVDALESLAAVVSQLKHLMLVRDLRKLVQRREPGRLMPKARRSRVIAADRRSVWDVVSDPYHRRAGGRRSRASRTSTSARAAPAPVDRGADDGLRQGRAGGVPLPGPATWRGTRGSRRSRHAVREGAEELGHHGRPCGCGPRHAA